MSHRFSGVCFIWPVGSPARLRSQPLLKVTFAAMTAMSATPAACQPVVIDSPAKIERVASTSLSAPGQSPIDAARISYGLARIGDGDKDPVALIVAAQILLKIGEGPATASQLGHDRAPAPHTGGKPMTVEAILGRAKALSSGRPDLNALADALRSTTATPFAMDIPSHQSGVAGRKQTATWRVRYGSQSKAHVVLAGDGQSDLGLEVLGAGNQPICRSKAPGDQQYCHWKLRLGGDYLVKIRNHGSPNQYVLRTY